MAEKIWPREVEPKPSRFDQHWGRFFLTGIGNPLVTAPDPLGPISYDPKNLPVPKSQ